MCQWPVARVILAMPKVALVVLIALLLVGAGSQPGEFL